MLARPVSIIVAVMVAPGSAALVPSTTVPMKEASCANAGAANKNEGGEDQTSEIKPHAHSSLRFCRWGQM